MQQYDRQVKDCCEMQQRDCHGKQKRITCIKYNLKVTKKALY